MSFFSLTDEEQAKFTIPKIVCPPLASTAPKHGAQLHKIEWLPDFETKLGIVDYTKIFINDNRIDKRGVVLTRRTVKSFWVEAVIKNCQDNEEKKQFLLKQINCALINDYWNQNNFKLDAFDGRLIEDPSGFRDPIGLRVLRHPTMKKSCRSTAMLLHHVDTNASRESGILKVRDMVYLPFIGLHDLKSISYLDLAKRVCRGDKEPVDEELMHAVWRGILFNMFYFESDEAKQEKLLEEDWASVNLQPVEELSPSHKRKLEED